ncbi:MAG: gfo/Idh/MocA family oxidoreductase [Planctomycetota bacterium]|nr:MAG: gfo/Idh/MocA family oxidoreductase [Planctomycetota bacterium]
MKSRKASRRRFLGTVAAGSAAVAVPTFWNLRSALGESANERLNVGSIGVGGRGSGIGHDAGGRGNMVACADVDLAHAERFASRYEGRCKVYKDYRELLDRSDIDIVTIGTPDHWHVPIAIAALKAGKDVYCEKPLTLTIEECKLIRQAVKESGRVFQVGTQQRSDRRFLQAIAIARSGRLGKTLTATCSIGGGPVGGPFPVTDPPETLDWDFWLGSTPKVPYSRERCHGTFRWWLEYSGGKLTDWGAHHVDIAQWGLGYEHSGPIEIEGEGNFPTIPDDFDPVAFFAGKVKLPNAYNTATTFQCTLKFDNGSKMIVRHGPDNGVWFEGENGRIFVNRGRISGKPIEEMTETDKQWLEEEVRKLYKGRELRGHMNNFFECVKERAEPISDVATHVRELTSCHMCNIAMLLKRKLRWDPEKEEFVGDEQANALMSRPRRAPYTLDM